MKMKRYCFLAIVLAVLGSTASRVQADVSYQVSTGYYDLTPTQFPGGNPVPSPWIGSPNTDFYGNTAGALSSDPEMNAVLVQNHGSTTLTLSALNFGGIDIFAFDQSFFTGPITILGGHNAIVSGFDGSDTGFSTNVAFTINGENLSFTDPNNGAALHGSTQFGSSDESVPWTLGYSTATNPVPEPSSFALLGLGALGLAVRAYRRRQSAI